MEAFNNNDKKCDFIINRRLATLKGECIEDMEEIYDASNYDCDHTRAVLLQNNVDILSFYYAARLFNVYLKRPYDVLSKIKEVILGQTNTQNLLNYYGLLEEVDFEDYEKAVLRLQNKTLR